MDKDALMNYAVLNSLQSNGTYYIGQVHLSQESLLELSPREFKKCIENKYKKKTLNQIQSNNNNNCNNHNHDDDRNNLNSSVEFFSKLDQIEEMKFRNFKEDN